MKTKIILICILLLAILFPSLIQAQYKLFPGQDILFPGNKTIFLYDGRPRVDIVTCKPYDAEGNPIGGASLSWSQQLWRHSEDGKRDTVYVLSGVIYVSVYDYYDDEKIKSIQDGYPHPNGEFVVSKEETFEYDQQGRLTLHHTIDYRPVIHDEKNMQYDYTKNTITQTVRNDKGETVTVTSISHTDKGYIAETNGEKSEYIFDEYLRPVKAGDVFYAYFDGGYTRYSETMYDTSRVDYYYDEKGYLCKMVDFSKSGNDWVPDCTYLYTYEPDHAVSNSLPQKKNKVYACEGKVVIESDKQDLVSIYAMNGQLVKMFRLSSLRQEVSLGSGIYIIHIGKDAHKLLIR